MVAGTGLSAQEAAQRLRDEGPNEGPQPPRRQGWRLLQDALREPMSQLLLLGVVIYWLLGDPLEALLLLSFVAVTLGLGWLQQQRTEKVLAALRDLASPRAVVLRDGQTLRIPGSEVVRGDWLLLTEGDRIPADAHLLWAHELMVDTSLLTGESVPVTKMARAEVTAQSGIKTEPASEARSALQENEKPAKTQTNNETSLATAVEEDSSFIVHAGTLVVRGEACAEVFATGSHSQMGQIGLALRDIDTPPTPLTQQTRRVVKMAAWLGGSVSLGFIVWLGWSRGDWLSALLSGIALAMSLLPEEFMLVLTVFMAMGAWRLSRDRVLTRRPAAIEALGSTTVLCTDKTGTLTHNRMAVVALSVAGATPSEDLHRWPATGFGSDPQPGDPSPLPEPPRLQALNAQQARLLDTAILASAAEPVDPMERAFHDLGQSHLSAERPSLAWALVQHYGLRPDLLAVAQAWVDGSHNEGLSHTVAAKGAPEAVMGLCHLDAGQHTRWTREAHRLAAQGLRVLGVARARHDLSADGSNETWPESPKAFDFEWLGLVALADPLRDQVPEAVAQCRQSGIRVAMITGDHPVTALAIARQAGIDTAGGALTGDDIEHLPDAELRDRLRQTSVFARIQPRQKLRLVQALRDDGEVVAMTGDGVNDAPALKAAHIGIAMGQRGTDVAREAASLVLLQDDFGAIVQGLRQGRRILDNLRKAMVFIVAVHVAVAACALLPLISGGPLLLGPLHIAILELLIDPVCAIVFEGEPEEEDLMRRPPRPPSAPIISAALLRRGLWQGLVCALVTSAVYAIGHRLGEDDQAVRAAVFASLVASLLTLVMSNRSLRQPWWRLFGHTNPALWWVTAGAAGVVALSLGSVAAQGPLGFHTPDGPLIAAGAVGALALLFLLEWGKLGRSPR